MAAGRGKKTQYRKLLTTFLAALLLPCGIALFICVRSALIMRDDLVKTRALAFERREESLRAYFTRLDTYAYEFSKNNFVSSLLQADEDTEYSLATLMYSWNKLPSIYAFSPVSDSVVVDVRAFFHRTGLVVSSGGTYNTRQWRYDYEIQGRRLSEWQEWTAGADATGRRCIPETLNVYGVEKPVLLYITALPVGYASGGTGALVVALDRERLAALLVPDGDTQVRVYDGEGRPLLYPGAETAVPEEVNATTYRYVSPCNGWTYVWTYPTATLLRELAPTLSVIIALALLLLVSAPLLSVLLAWQGNKPVREIAGLLSETEGDVPDDYDEIKRGVRRLLDRKKSLEDRLSEHRETVYTVTMRRLLDNNLPPGEATLSMLRSLQFPVEARGVHAVAIRLYDRVTSTPRESVENLQIQQSVLLDSLQRIPDTAAHAYSADRLVLLVFEREEEELRAMLSRLAENLARRGHTNIRMGVGGAVAALTDVHRSCAEAWQSLYLSDPSQTIRFYGDVAQEAPGSLYFPPSEEQKLLRMLHAGQGEEAARLLDQLWEENGKNRLTPELTDVLLSELRLCLIKALTDGTRCDAPQKSELLASLSRPPALPYDELYAWLWERCAQVGACFAAPRRDRAYYLICDVTEYLETLYADPEISLTSAAARFHVSEAYLSHQFKEQAGENFGSCLERIRQGHAHTLLTQTALPIDDIAQKIGYYSANTFRKAFKRFHGISPAEYRASFER